MFLEVIEPTEKTLAEIYKNQHKSLIIQVLIFEIVLLHTHN